MGIAVIEKTFQVLEGLARLGEPVPLVLLSVAADLPKPTAYRILQSLADLGYVAQEEGTGHYFATDRLSELAACDLHLSLKERARPLMKRLHGRFNETVNLGILEGSKVVYALVMETTQSLRWVVRPGRSDPYYCTALGRAITASLPLAQQKVLLQKTRLEPVGAKTITSKENLESILKETRRRGWAYEEEETAEGVACLAFPLALWGISKAAISLSIPTSRLTPDLRASILEEIMSLHATAPTTLKELL
jgi:DNA-binding IclR family transcriptional regulator